MRWTAFRGVGGERGEVETLQQTEDLQHRHAARAGRPHAANPVAPVVEAHGRPYMGAVGGEIRTRKRSRIHGIVLHGGDDFGRDPSPVEGRPAPSRAMALIVSA